MGEQKVVYFISSDDGPIKIGWATNVRKRLYALQTSHHEKLNILGLMLGGPDLESKLHKLFDKFRLRGEWFQRDISILDFIDANCDEQLWVPERKDVRVDAETGTFGIVQILDGPHKGKYGYYDDDSIETEVCEFCHEAELRKVQLKVKDKDYECPSCEDYDMAIVYVGPISKGRYTLIAHNKLRVVDEGREPEVATAVAKLVFGELLEHQAPAPLAAP